MFMLFLYAGVLEHVVYGAIADAVEGFFGAAANVERGNEVLQMEEGIVLIWRLLLEHVACSCADLSGGEGSVQCALIDDAAARG